ncbi:MAG: hypothetical protein JO020_14650 [Chloroflexi bacterium]|nr:hypothetical protein [Chloroflexota bacterium]
MTTLEPLGYSDQGGRPHGIQIMVYHEHAYIGQARYGGFSVIDVSNPREPKPAGFVPTAPATLNIHLQVHDNLLLVVDSANLFSIYGSMEAYYARSMEGWSTSSFGKRGEDFMAGMRVYDISKPAEPRQIGYLEVEGLGIHRLWYDGGRYAYGSALLEGYTDHILLIIDMNDPTHPVEAGRWWIPGMWRAGGESPGWKSGRVALHHAVVADGIAYGSWRDGGLTIVDVHDPAHPQLLAHRNWSPPFGGGTHSALPLPDRNLLIDADEAVLENCADGTKYTWVFDVREKTNPISIATFPVPSDRDYCRLPGKFGPHNLHENREGTFQSSETIFVTYQNAGLRLFSIANPFRPEEIAAFVPPAQNDRPLASADVFVDKRGLVYMTDAVGGLHILEFRP